MSSSDKKEIDDQCKKFFDAFNNKKGKLKLDVLRDLFIEGAVIIKNSGSDPEIYDVDGFIRPREKILNDGTLKEFSEWELHERTDIFGNIAQRFSSYKKTGIQNGKHFETKGMKTFQFIKTDKGWKICSLAWDDEREDLQIPKE